MSRGGQGRQNDGRARRGRRDVGRPSAARKALASAAGLFRPLPGPDHAALHQGQLLARASRSSPLAPKGARWSNEPSACAQAASRASSGRASALLASHLASGLGVEAKVGQARLTAATSARPFATRQQVVEATAEYRPCWSGILAPAAGVQAKVRQARLAAATLRPNPSLERRPHEACHPWAAQGSRRLHCPAPRQGATPRGAPQLER
jgi:hypothetical protein